jgi:hypothetical protein
MAATEVNEQIAQNSAAVRDEGERIIEGDPLKNRLSRGTTSLRARYPVTL